MGMIDKFDKDKLSVLIADDHEMILDMFSMYLEGSAGMEVTTAATLDDGLDQITEHGPFDVVLLDLNMPGMNGVSGLQKAIQANADNPVAIITGTPSPRMIDEIMKSGASGIVLKTTPVRSLANAIRFMYSGERYVPLTLVQERQPSNNTAQNGRLSNKEMTVLSLLGEGKQNKQIANALQLAEPTVKMHVTSICRKLGARNRTQAVIMARDLGLV